MTAFLELRHASVVRNEKTILRNISLEINLGEQAAILGPNGSGKSTLIRMLSGDIYPLHRPVPAIRIFGRERWNLFDLRTRLAVVSSALQERQHPGCTGLELILSGLFGSIGLHAHHQVSVAQHKHALEIARDLGIEKIAHKTVETFSSGELRRFLIGRALINNPRIIVLDEPTVSLDVYARTRFLQNLRALARRGHSIILVTHLPEEIIPEITRVIILKDGKIFADGGKAEVMRGSVLSAAFNLPLRVRRSGGYYHVRSKEQ